MTRTTNARVAGFTFLIYIAVALTGMVLSNRAASGEGIAAKLASIAQHASEYRVAFVLELVSCFCALVLAVTLYAITRDQDPDLAMLAMTCRVAEGVIGGIALPRMLGRLWLATAARSRRSRPRGSERARRVIGEAAELELGYRRDLLRRWQHAFRLSPPARPNRPRRPGLARPARVDPCRGEPSPAARRSPSTNRLRTSCGSPCSPSRCRSLYG